MAGQGHENEHSTSVGSDEHDKAMEFKVSGNEKFHKSDYKRAIADYKKGLLHEPNHPDLHANLSAAYIHLEKYIDAEIHAVYAIDLNPNSHKGYTRAAKAAHGRCMTNLALKHITAGLAAVTDPGGIRELTKLKTQYTKYLSLASNAERELDFDSDRYQSLDEDECSEVEDETDDEDPNTSIAVQVEPASVVAPTKTNVSEPPQRTKSLKHAESSTSILNQSFEKNSEENSPIPEKFKSTDEGMEDEEANTFFKLCKELTRDQQLIEKIEEFKDQLKTGSEAYLSGNYRKAAESFKTALERVGETLKLQRDYQLDDKQYHIIKYAYSAALINLGSYDELVKALHTLQEMETYYVIIPALYIQMAEAYCKLNRFKSAQEPLRKLQDVIDQIVIFPSFNWPGTMEVIEESTPNGLKDALENLNVKCRMTRKPDATCYFDNCLKISSHIIPAKYIHISDPDFIGFVRITCEEKCHIEFHIPCWKSFKETFFGFEKTNDKDMLGRKCFTTDCVKSGGEPSQITIIAIIGADGKTKSVNKMDTKLVTDFNKKAKTKKKNEKKDEKKDDKEKGSKPKKTTRLLRGIKKDLLVSVEENLVETNNVDLVKTMESYNNILTQWRPTILDNDDDEDDWNPLLPFYGQYDESMKASDGKFLDQTTIDAGTKEFLFSFFSQILEKEGALKQSDVEEMDVGFNLKDILPDVTCICDLLIESTRFCQMEDYICLSGQLQTTCNTVTIELEAVHNELFVTAMHPETSKQQSGLPDPSVHPKPQAYESSKYESQLDEYVDVFSCEEYSEDSEDEGSEGEDIDCSLVTNKSPYLFETLSATKTELMEEMEVTPPKPIDNVKALSYQELINEITRVKSLFKEPEPELEPERKETDSSNDNKSSGLPESAAMTAIGDIKSDSSEKGALSNTFHNEPDEGIISSNESLTPSNNEGQDDNNSYIVIVSKDDDCSVNANIPEANFDVYSIESLPFSYDEVVNENGNQECKDHSECNKASQSKVETAEQHMQTSCIETKDELSQTKDLYKELYRKIEDLTAQIAETNEENLKLTEELDCMKTENEQMKITHEKRINLLEDEHRKTIDKYKTCQKQRKEQSLKTEAEFKHREEELGKKISHLTNKLAVTQTEIAKFKKEKDTYQKETSELIRELNSKYLRLEKSMKLSVQKSQQAHLQIIKVYWERQIALMKKRTIEKISEMQSWFSKFASGEMEDLPSWELIQEKTLQWSDFHKNIQQMEANLQARSGDLEKKIALGGSLEEQMMQLLPALPEEPAPLPLDKIHDEIMEKHLNKITELTKLVANQQLEIEKSKDIKKSRSSSAVKPVMKSELDGHALQFPYTQFFPPPVHTIENGAFKMSTFIPPLNMIPSTTQQQPGAAFTMPPPPVDMTHNLHQTSADKKDSKPAEKPVIQKPEASAKASSSRESTPVPVGVPTVSKKKKKKGKSENNGVLEASTAASVCVEPSSWEVEPNDDDDDASEWNVVVPRSTYKHVVATPAGAQLEFKMKNKEKLLNRMQPKFPTTSLKDLEEVIRQIREDNNSSLSGLPFDEIEARIKRYLDKRQLQRSSTMDLIKFSEKPWVTVKEHDTSKSKNYQIEECAVCLDVMDLKGKDRTTKIGCNHEFHTKCLRKWLKEKRVCPLCYKYTTMPDEFPAL